MQGKHFPILFYVAMFKLTNASLSGLPCELQFKKLLNQACFVEMIVRKELVVSNHKNANIVEELRQRSAGRAPRWQRRKPQEKLRARKTVPTMRPRRRPRAARRFSSSLQFRYGTR